MSTTTGQATLSTINLIFAEGVDNSYSFVYSTVIGGVTTPVNMSTGWVATSQVRTIDLSTVILDLTSHVTLGSAGQIDIEVLAADADTQTIRANESGAWDLKLTHGTETVRFTSGAVTISHGVTRAS